mgnify:CR=1 FL=1
MANETPEGGKIKRFFWPFLFFMLRFGGAATFRPYTVLYYQSLAFTGAQIGLLTGITPLVSLVSMPLITGFADRTQKHKLIMSISLIAAVLGLILYPFLSYFLPIFILTVLITFFQSPMGPLSDSAALFMLGKRKNLFSRVRLGGTLGFSVAATLAGTLVENQGLKAAFWGAALVFFTAFLVSLKLTHSKKEKIENLQKGRTFDLIKNPRFLLFLIIVFTGGIANATINTYLFPYMKSLGARESIMGLALTMGTVAELPILFFASHFIKKFKAYSLIVFSTIVTCLRFLLLAITPNPSLVLAIQLLNGFTFPLLSVAGVTYVDDHAQPGYRATAQGLFNGTVLGVASAVGGFTGGILFDRLGPRGMYFTFFVVIAAILTIVSLVQRALPHEEEP